MGRKGRRREVERLWPARLRWRMRGAWHVADVPGPHARRRGAAPRCRRWARGPGGIVPGDPARGVREPRRSWPWSRRSPAGRCARAPARPPAPGRRRLRGDGADRARSAAAIAVAGVAHRPGVRGPSADPRAVFVALHDYVRAHAPAYVASLAPGGRACGSSPTTTARASRGVEPRRALCVFVDTERGGRRRCARDTDQTPNDMRHLPVDGCGAGRNGARSGRRGRGRRARPAGGRIGERGPCASSASTRERTRA